MSDDPNKRAEDWDRFREFLSLLARVQLSPRWRAKIDLSGLVQQTLLEAFQAGDELAAVSDAQKAAWLKRALANNLADEVRKLNTARRGGGRELSLEARLDESISRLEQLVPAAESTPSQKVVREERLLELAQALMDLPEAQRQAIELHHLRGHSLAEVAETLGTTKPAVAGLLHRGLKRLREVLDDRAGSK
jgi:RNA polymerase sigma-70 factor (ECF subfamily)